MIAIRDSGVLSGQTQMYQILHFIQVFKSMDPTLLLTSFRGIHSHTLLIYNSKSANTYELTRVHSHHDIRSSSPSVRMSAAASTRFSTSPARTASPRSVSSAESFSSLKVSDLVSSSQLI